MEETELLVIWPTDRCNLQCRYCYAEAGVQGEDLSWETLQKFLDRFAGRQVKVQFAGGEPLLRQEILWKTAEYLKKGHWKYSLQVQTNGTLITPQTAQRLKQYGFAVGISMDGGKEINEKNRGRTGDVLRGIACLGEAGIEVGINGVLTGEDLQGPSQLARMALVFPNIRGIAIDLLRKSGRAITEGGPEPPQPEQVSQALRMLYEMTKSIEKLTGRTLAIREVEEARQRLQKRNAGVSHCYACLGRSHVLVPDGKIYPCGSLVGEEAWCMGNADEKNDGRRRLPAVLRPQCSSCQWNPWCTRGCPARYMANGSDGQEAECMLKKTAFELAYKEIEARRQKR